MVFTRVTKGSYICLIIKNKYYESYKGIKKMVFE